RDGDGRSYGGRRDVLEPQHQQDRGGLHTRREQWSPDGHERRVQHRVGGRHPAGLRPAAEHHEGRGGHHARGSDHGPGWQRQYGDRVHGEHHGGDRDKPGQRGRVGHQDRGGRRGGRDLGRLEHRQGGGGLHPHGDGRREHDERGVQHHAGGCHGPRLQRRADEYGGRRGDHAGGSDHGPGWQRQYGDRVHGEHHGGDRDEPEQRDLVRHEDRGGGRWGRHVLRAEHRQGRHRLHAHGDGRGEHAEHGVQRHGGDRHGARLQRRADEHGGRCGDHPRGPGYRPGRQRQHGEGVHGEHHGGDRDQSEHRDLVRYEDRGGGRGGRDLLGAEHRQGGDGL